jgi:serine/threonine protein kinase
MADDAPESDQQFPAPFGKYLLTELLAVGGMAEVYRAKIFGASGFEKEMVVKRILPKYARNPSFVQLTHGNIVPIYELGELEGSYYIAMEYVAGNTVLDVLRTSHTKQTPMPWPHALGIAAEVARGLYYAHTRKGPDGADLGLVHRDINPRNIVITPAGEVKILDFGIARASTKRHQTASGVIKGTPGYMSPEQMYAKPIDARSDIYCVGILLHELLTLQRLFPVWDVKEMRQMFESHGVDPPSASGLVTEPAVDEVVMKALASDLDERFANAAEFEEALRQAIASSGTAVTGYGLAKELKAIEEQGEPAESTKATQPVPQPKPAPAPQPAQPPTTSEKMPAAQGPRAIALGPVKSDVPTDPEPVAKPKPAPATQPMDVSPPPSAKQTGPMDAPFVISLASEVKQTGPLAPIPPTSARELSAGPRTSVLAQNAEIEWFDQVGDDAEMLALAKAVSAHPSQTRRVVLGALIVLVIGGLLGGAFYGEQLKKMVDRALSGKKLRNGAIVVKTTPSGARVTLDGEEVGKTNMRLEGVDPDENHQLVVEPEGMDPIIHEFGPADFRNTEGLPTFFWVKEFRPEPAAKADAGPPDAGVKADTPKKKKKKPRKRRRRRRK